MTVKNLVVAILPHYIRVGYGFSQLYLASCIIFIVSVYFNLRWFVVFAISDNVFFLCDKLSLLVHKILHNFSNTSFFIASDVVLF